MLVADGHLLQAQQRLGHKDASTTLRQYCHALPLHDQDVADHLDALLQQHAWPSQYRDKGMPIGAHARRAEERTLRSSD